MPKISYFYCTFKGKEKDKFYCVISFNKWDISNKNPIGQIENFIGSVGYIDNEIEMLLYRTRYLSQKEKIVYNNLEEIEQTNKHTFSIDPEGCQDIDDALHYTELSDGIEIGIHIVTNVARFIKNIDTDIYSSIYLDDSQFNMLSEKHSFNLCSLLGNTKEEPYR